MTPTPRARRGRTLRAGLVAAACLPITVGALSLPAQAEPTTTPASDAQIVDGNAFLSNGYVEVGSRPNGSFGSTASAPAGYHPNTGTILGFRSDREKNGWGVGVDDGDFFTPGNPYEGWSLQVGAGTSVFANSNRATGVPGTWQSTSTADGASGTWRSDAPVGGVAVTQTASVRPGSQVLNVAVTLTNTTDAAIADVFYGRSVDPDNCLTRTEAVCDTDGDGVADSAGNFRTRNTVRSQAAGSGTASVSASQSDGSYFDLRTTAADSLVGIQAGACNYSDLSAMFAAGDACAASTAAGATTFSDSLIYLATRTTSLAAGASRSFKVQYVLSEDAAESLPTTPEPTTPEPTTPAPTTPAPTTPAPTVVPAPAAPRATTAGTVYSTGTTTASTLTGQATPGATITIREGSKVVGTAVVNASGVWTVKISGLSAGRHHFTATQTVAGVTSKASAVGSVVVERLGVRVFKDVQRTKAARPLVRGRGNAGATVVVRTTAGRLIGKAVVQKDGRWRMRTVKLARGTYKIRGFQTVGGKTVRSGVVKFRALPR